jgi:sugar phosphate isomerase/epimerase
VLKDRPLEEVITIAEEIGYEGIELRAREPHLPPETKERRAKEIKKALEEAGLPVTCIASYTHYRPDFSNAEAQKERDDFRRFVDLAVILNAPIVRHNPAGSETHATDDDYKFAAEWYNEICEVAAEGDASVGIEIHNGSLVESAESCRKLIDMTGRDNLGAIHDAGNMYISGSDFGEQSVEVLGDKLIHVHVKDELRVKDPNLPGAFKCTTMNGEETFVATLLGEGGADHFPLFKALAKRGYTGYLSAECHMTVGKKDVEVARHEYRQMMELIEKAMAE